MATVRSIDIAYDPESEWFTADLMLDNLSPDDDFATSSLFQREAPTRRALIAALIAEWPEIEGSDELSGLDRCRGKDGNLPAYGWPGGYPLYYVASDDSIVCPNCANDPAEGTQDRPIVGSDINWEDASLYCDAQYAGCVGRIESAYSD